jgi:hypothetical protein
MTDDPIPPSDHVARHCEKRFFFDGGDEIGPGNFELRGHAYVSVAWLEKYAAGSIESKMAALRKFYADRNIRRVGNRDKFGVLNVGNAIDLLRRKSVPPGKSIRILHQPVTSPVDKVDEGHAGIFDTDNDNHVNLMLAEACTPYPGRVN